ncbi:MAG: DUF389 domain-containing protein [Prevotella sp.]|nr:DUF389 domain-containing protein [Prevotella sp.]
MDEEKSVGTVRHGSLWHYFHNLLDMRGNMLSYDEIDDMMREQAEIHGANMWILMLAILIASIGLNVNSTAVIIGAMLISPLMSGIMTMGYSIAVRDIRLLLKALVRFATQVAICLITSTIYFKISPLTVPSEEMIARTSPTAWDVLIALFGGLAGMIGHTRTKHSNVIPGVAIATALMPPLCTAGYGIASGQFRFFIGAFYLFIINTLFIAISTALIALVLKIPYHKSVSKRSQKKVNLAIVLIAVCTVIPSVFVGAYTVYDSVVDTNIASYLNDEFRFDNTQIVKSETNKQKKIISVSLVGETISGDVIDLLKSQLSDYGLEEYDLHVTQNVVTETDDSDKVTIILQENTISDLRKQIDEQAEEMSRMSESIKEYESENSLDAIVKALPKKAEITFSYLKKCRVGIMSDGNGDVITMIADTEKSLTDRELAAIENWLIGESGVNSAETDITYVGPTEKLYEIYGVLYDAAEEYGITLCDVSEAEGKVHIGLSEPGSENRVLSFLYLNADGFEADSVSFFFSEGLSYVSE